MFIVIKVMKMINIIRANPLIIFHTPITVLSIKHLLIKFPTRKFTVLSTNIYLSNSPQEKLYYLILQMRKPKHRKVKQLFQLEQLSCAVFSLLGWPFRPGHCGNICPEHSNLVVLLSSSSSLGFALRRLCPIPLALSVFSNFPKVTVVSWMKRRVAN